MRASSQPHRALLRALLLATLPALLPASPLHAQTMANDSLAPRRIISTNPLLLIAGFFSGEYEQRRSDKVALAVSASHLAPDNERFDHLDAKVRLYPSERGLHGVAFAAGIGYSWVRDETELYEPCGGSFGFECLPRDTRVTTFGSPTFSIETHYQWLLGRSRSTAITLGGGAKRYLAGSTRYFEDSGRVIPTFRFSLGYAF